MSGENPNAFCSFCRKSYSDVGPVVEGPGDVYICGECVELCQSIIEQEKMRRGIVPTAQPHEEAKWVASLWQQFLEAIFETMREKQLSPEELALVKEIRVKIAELKTLVAGRGDRQGSA